MDETFVFNHTPVMLNECIEALNIKNNGIYVDGTLGGAGHSSVIASKLIKGKLIGIDKDDVALKVSGERLKKYSFVQLVKGDFKNYKSILDSLNIQYTDGVLLDLGVSSYQIDTPSRGFSYRFDAPLDMRMDSTQSKSAYNIVNEYSTQRLIDILYAYGEESFAKNIVRKIDDYRKNKKIETTGELVEIIKSALPKKLALTSACCKKTFQAIRIEVNEELTGLDKAIRDMADSLNHGGRLVILTFHSLEDRIVKNVFKELSSDCICDKSIPVCVCHHHASVKLINHKPITASEEELANNSRSASAKLRIVEKL